MSLSLEILRMIEQFFHGKNLKIFLASVVPARHFLSNRTRQGYARKRILKPAGLFLYAPKCREVW
ncbi:hypothetical protein KJ975_00150 [Myxococcota bacterium]|nr:hypothetical protein [Myxococcota bacterium]